MTDTRYSIIEQDQATELALNLETLKDLDPNQGTADDVLGGSAARTTKQASVCTC